MSILREVVVDGCRVRYTEAGHGEPILLLHGYPQDHRCWRHQLPELARSHRVIAPDWFGFGRSEQSFDIAPTYAVEAARVGRLASALGLERFNLFAHDYGGYLALGFLCREPKRVRRLALLNSRAHRNFTPAFQRFSHAQHWIARHRLGTRGLIRAAHRRGLEPYVRRGCFTAALRDEYLGWLSREEGLRFYFWFFAHYPVEAPSELTSSLAQIRVPTAIIYGDRDAYVPFATAEELSARIPNATLTRLARTSHYVMEERPDEVTRALKALLATSS
jgi:pimeloyl-ACP methyl ester carboxylesterase